MQNYVLRYEVADHHSDTADDALRFLAAQGSISPTGRQIAWGVTAHSRDQALAVAAGARDTLPPDPIEITSVTVGTVVGSHRAPPLNKASLPGIWASPLHRFYFSYRDPDDSSAGPVESTETSTPRSSSIEWVVDAESWLDAWALVVDARDARFPLFDQMIDITHEPNQGERIGVQPVRHDTRRGIAWSSASKRIVLCFDGTSNEINVQGELGTNVLRIFRAIKTDSSSRQLALYIPGIGTIASKRRKTAPGSLVTSKLDQAFGRGIRKDVTDGYRFLVENYRLGDSVYLFGFSRGAHAAKALAAMMFYMGVVDPRKGVGIDYAVKYFWRNTRGEVKPEFLSRAARFRSTFSRNVDVRFLGLWDAVSSVGWLWSHRLPGTDFLHGVRSGRHAVAIDETRRLFGADIWNPGTTADASTGPTAEPVSSADPTPQATKLAASLDAERRRGWITAYFAGLHSEVGGTGEVGEGLDDITLRWMARWASHADLEIERSEIPPPTPMQIASPARHHKWYLLAIPPARRRPMPSNARVHISALIKFHDDASYASRHSRRGWLRRATPFQRWISQQQRSGTGGGRKETEPRSWFDVIDVSNIVVTPGWSGDPAPTAEQIPSGVF